ncbi:DinB family protein [Aquimarina hainanensis]|uniref:DinB family protein n=1 Tax=Aquimarina hainanensis TaxID=1578017 RepID=A0ABW5NDH4_9FLAO
MIDQLTTEEYNTYYRMYIQKATSANILEGLRERKQEFVDFISAIPSEKHRYAYADGKWTVLEVFQHLIDTERIFAYRALRFARNDKTPIMGFEQDEYVPFSNANQYTIPQLVADFEAVRSGTITLFSGFTEEMLTRIGNASGSPMSARAVGYILQGHQIHHFQVLQERYL